jgi:hypothetical protein
MIAIAEPIDADALRIRHEFLTMPDLRVSVEWCATLLNVPPRHALQILESLTKDGFLAHAPDGQYIRAAFKLR